MALHDAEDGRPSTLADPHAGHVLPPVVPVAAALPIPAPLPRTSFTVTADDGQDSAADVLDGDPDTAWRTAETAFPHVLTIDTHNRVAVGGLSYLPASGSATGRIGQYTVQISDDGSAWSTPLATGTFADDALVKTVTINTVVTRFVRLNVLSEAGARGNSTAAAEINLLGGTDPVLPRTGWTGNADSAESTAMSGAVVNALDGNTASFWHSKYAPAPANPLPHWFRIDMHGVNLVSGLTYLTRQDASKNGTIGQYRIETSMDGATWGPVAASGSFVDVKTAQTVTFDSRLARYVRLTALAEAGRRGPWSAAAEINLLGRSNPTLSRTGWTVAASSQETTALNASAGLVLDGDAATFWHSRYAPAPAAPLPHTLTLDLHESVTVGGLSYLPRPAASANGRIGKYKIATSPDGDTWTDRISDGVFADNPGLQTVLFPPVGARYVRLTAVSEAGNRGPWSAAAEINLLGPAGAVVPKRGTWSVPVGFPLVPVAAAQLPNGKILTWSAFQKDNYSGGTGGTVTATYDPATGVVTQRTVTQTGHDMFCPGISMLPDGRVLVTGGNNSEKTSIYNPATDAWTTGPNMKTARGYQASVTLGDGRVFTIGGSWSGPRGGVNGAPHKAGEIWSPSGGWVALPGADALPMLTADANPNGDYRKDNHAWLFAWSGGKVLQAGPSRKMNWYDVSGTGSVAAAGTRGDDGDAMNGNAVMYDAGKILTIGGAPSYEQVGATANAYVLTVAGSTVSTRKVASMANTRVFHNSVVLPDGKVVVVGGQNFAVPFSDNAAVLSAEMWDPVSESFTTMATATVPRTYHSVSLLMPDGRVFAGGGGLCGTGCSTNHFDGQIFTPPYLLNADGSPAARPSITAAPASTANGAKIMVGTSRAVTAFAIVRMGSATHSVNTDQRRLSLVPAPAEDGSYELTIPADPGVAVPGYWMLFAMDSKGVPSVAKVIRIG
ncbi:MAG TPA: discoidin domain-containing protein [Actinoplanes sp.]